MNIRTNNITQGAEATDKLLNGIKTATQAIRLSYGPGGLNAIVENQLYPYHQVANDAQTIIQAIEVEDPVEKRGLGLLKELSDKAEKDSGDGRKTTSIIAEEIIEHGRNIEIAPVELKRQLDSLIPVIEKAIDEIKTEITVEDVHKVATIAGESEEIGKLVGDIYKKIGKEGIIHVEGSGTYDNSITFIEGVRFTGTGYLSPFMVHDEEAIKFGQKETRAVYENPSILVTKRKITHLNDINPLLDKLTKNGKKDLVIFTDDMDSTVASILVNAHRQHIVNVLIIKAPVLWKNYVFEDFAKITGATILEDASGINYKNLALNHLGTCGKIIVDKDETVVMEGADISDHIAMLESEKTNDNQLRLSWLKTKTAILKLGANNESELSYKRLKTADAISSAKLALKDGVVEGGGKCLKQVANTIQGDKKVHMLVKNALIAPHKQICANLGSSDFSTENVYDAATVVKNAVRNAISLASTVLTAGMVVTLLPKEPVPSNPLNSLGQNVKF